MDVGEKKNWFRAWMSRPLVCKLGFHEFSWDEWSFCYCQFNGCVSFHCPQCQHIIKEIPFDDIPTEKRRFINNTIGVKND